MAAPNDITFCDVTASLLRIAVTYENRSTNRGVPEFPEANSLSHQRVCYMSRSNSLSV